MERSTADHAAARVPPQGTPFVGARRCECRGTLSAAHADVRCFFGCLRFSTGTMTKVAKALVQSPSSPAKTQVAQYDRLDLAYLTATSNAHTTPQKLPATFVSATASTMPPYGVSGAWYSHARCRVCLLMPDSLAFCTVASHLSPFCIVVLQCNSPLIPWVCRRMASP